MHFVSVQECLPYSVVSVTLRHLGSKNITEKLPEINGSRSFKYRKGDLGSISGSGRSPGEGKGYLLQYSGLENSMGSQRLGHH